MKTVREILTEHLKTIGADGLAGDECGCGLDDFMPCYAGCGDCVPARKEIAPADHEFAGEETYVPMEAPDARMFIEVPFRAGYRYGVAGKWSFEEENEAWKEYEGEFDYQVPAGAGKEGDS